METSNESISEEQTELINRIKDDMKLAKYITTKCKVVGSKKTIMDKMTELMFYTGVEYTEEIGKYFNKQDKTYTDWIENNKKQDVHKVIVSYEHLRKAVYIEYVEKLRLPTRKALAHILVSRFDYETRIMNTLLNMDIKKHGFIWKQLGGTKKFIILENTAQVARRMRYLYEMKQIREANRVIVHVELRKINVDVDTRNPNIKETHEIEIAVAASPQIGLIGALVNTAADGSINIDEFLNSRLSKISDAVFIIEPSKILQENDTDVPTEHSKKKIMIEWLEKHNIPHLPESHRAQLFALVEMYKARHPINSNNLELLRAKNFKVLFRPPELSYMQYFTFLWRNLDELSKNSSSNDLDTIKSEYVKLIEEVGDEDWKGYDCDIADLEQKMFQEDEKLEMVIDKLMEAIENNSLTRADFEECESNVDNDDYIDSILTK